MFTPSVTFSLDKQTGIPGKNFIHKFFKKAVQNYPYKKIPVCKAIIMKSKLSQADYLKAISFPLFSIFLLA